MNSDQLSQYTTPQRRIDVGEAQVGDGLLLATEAAARPVVLDPIAAALWSSFDGETTIGELAEDLADVVGETPTHRGSVDAFVRELAARGYLTSPLPENPPLPRQVLAPVPSGSCLASRLGLARSALAQATIEGVPRFRFGATDHDLVREICGSLPTDVTVEEPDPSSVEMLIGRFSPGRRPRTQAILGTMGERFYTSTDMHSAHDALRRSVSGLVEAHRSPHTAWALSPALLTSAGVTLLHPGLHEAVTGPLRRPLADRGVDLLATSLARLDRSPTDRALLVEPPPVRLGDPVTCLPLRGAALVVPPRPSDWVRSESIAPLLRRWDQQHIELVPAILEAGTLDIDISTDADALLDLLSRYALG